MKLREIALPDSRFQQVIFMAEEYQMLREIAVQLTKLNENIEKLTNK